MMNGYYRVRTFHGTYLAIYHPTGAICAVAESRLGDMFQPIFLYRGDELEPESGILLGEAKETGFFIRPYVFGNKAIPVHVRDGAESGYVSLVHPGTRFHLAVHPPVATDHFATVIADREKSSIWESFVLETVSEEIVPAPLRILVQTIANLPASRRTLIELYSAFGCDGLATRPDTPSIASIVSAFDSLGDNCEFGFAQRNCGAEPLGLLRFGGNLGVDGVTVALREQFKRIGQKSNMVCIQHPHFEKEYLVTDKSYNMIYHTWRDVASIDLDIIIDEESKKLRYLKNKMIEDFEDAAKIFVFKYNYRIEEEKFAGLFSALRSFGDTTLLSIIIADHDHPAGTVVRVADGLLRGYIDRFAPYTDAWDISVPAWIRICRNAYAMWR